MIINEVIDKYLKTEYPLDNLSNLPNISAYKKIKLESLSHSTGLKNIWEIADHLKCPLIGGCLTIEEHKKILIKAGCQVKMKRSYHLHNMIMSNLQDRNIISVKVDNFLKHKYRKDIQGLKKLDEKEYMERWDESLSTGDMEALYYVAAVRRDLSASAIERIFGDVHMINHINLHEINRVKQRLTMYESTYIKLSKLFSQ